MVPGVAASAQKSDSSRGIRVMNLPVISCVAEFFKIEKEIALPFNLKRKYIAHVVYLSFNGLDKSPLYKFPS
jgi:hypothetical protein